MDKKIRVRFAPSPTGDPHVGNIRTAVFNWLFARHNKGTVIVRVEDTDQTREVPGATQALLESLKWLGLDWDEGPDIGGKYGPYLQSLRLDGYRDVASQLLKSGHAYYCFCSTQRLKELRNKQSRLKKDPGYDRRCRGMGIAERIEWEKGKTTPVVRFKMPLEGTTSVNDMVRGTVTFENKLIDDFVLLKSDGFPTYHLANVVDDKSMDISHVVRAEEWLSSIPRHLQIYSALGWSPPDFAHVPMILASDKTKLSKRHGAASLLEYKKDGYLPEAVVNFLALLGWSLDDKTEVLNRQELVEYFSITKVSKAGAIFDQQKLLWLNSQYLRALDDKKLASELLEYWGSIPDVGLKELPEIDYLEKIVPLIRERIKIMSDALALTRFFFDQELDYSKEELIQKNMDHELTRSALESAHDLLSKINHFDSEPMEAEMRVLADTLGIKIGQLFGSIRVAVTGLKVAPPLFESLEILGREKVLCSIRTAIDKF
tara:strand:- start:19385 stop:20845 length:1461 start_codon:yes stop_codon:yes gene_type:complete